MRISVLCDFAFKMFTHTPIIWGGVNLVKWTLLRVPLGMQ